MKQQRLLIVFIVALLTSAITFLNVMPLQLGLDLKGGSQLTIQLRPTKDIQNIVQEDLEAASMSDAKQREAELMFLRAEN